MKNALQKFIDNSNISLSYDDDNNGFIDPLEYGYQSWSNGSLNSLTIYSWCYLNEIPTAIGDFINLEYLHFG